MLQRASHTNDSFTNYIFEEIFISFQVDQEEYPGGTMTFSDGHVALLFSNQIIQMRFSSIFIFFMRHIFSLIFILMLVPHLRYCRV